VTDLNVVFALQEVRDGQRAAYNEAEDRQPDLHEGKGASRHQSMLTGMRTTTGYQWRLITQIDLRLLVR